MITLNIDKINCGCLNIFHEPCEICTCVKYLCNFCAHEKIFFFKLDKRDRDAQISPRY